METMTKPRFKKGDRVRSVYFDSTAVVIDVKDYKIMVRWDDESEEDIEFPRMFHPDDGFVKIEEF